MERRNTNNNNHLESFGEKDVSNLSKTLVTSKPQSPEYLNIDNIKQLNSNQKEKLLKQRAEWLKTIRKKEAEEATALLKKNCKKLKNQPYIRKRMRWCKIHKKLENMTKTALQDWKCKEE